MCPKLRHFKLVPWLLRGEEYSIAGESPGSGAGQPGREAHLSHSPGKGEAAGPRPHPVPVVRLAVDPLSDSSSLSVRRG